MTFMKWLHNKKECEIKKFDDLGIIIEFLSLPKSFKKIKVQTELFLSSNKIYSWRSCLSFRMFHNSVDLDSLIFHICFRMASNKCLCIIRSISRSRQFSSSYELRCLQFKKLKIQIFKSLFFFDKFSLRFSPLAANSTMNRYFSSFQNIFEISSNIFWLINFLNLKIPLKNSTYSYL